MFDIIGKLSHHHVTGELICVLVGLWAGYSDHVWWVWVGRIVLCGVLLTWMYRFGKRIWKRYKLLQNVRHQKKQRQQQFVFDLLQFVSKFKLRQLTHWEYVKELKIILSKCEKLPLDIQNIKDLVFQLSSIVEEYRFKDILIQSNTLTETDILHLDNLWRLREIDNKPLWILLTPQYRQLLQVISNVLDNKEWFPIETNAGNFCVKQEIEMALLKIQEKHVSASQTFTIHGTEFHYPPETFINVEIKDGNTTKSRLSINVRLGVFLSELFEKKLLNYCKSKIRDT